MNAAQTSFRRICTERGLDPDTMPPAAALVVETLGKCVLTLGTSIAADPGLMQWFAAALAAYAENAAQHAEHAFQVFAELSFDDDGYPL